MPLGTSITSYLSGGSSRKKSGSSYTSGVDRYNKWEDKLNDIYNQISGREKFSYDMNSDALYKQYAQQYQQNAKLAMEDTVGQVSALTGGYANSYAATAGQAMYNQQMQGLNDKALEIYQLALQEYNMEGDRLNNLYGITSDAYGMEQDRINAEVAEAQWAAEFDESQRQYDTSLAFDYARAAAQDAQWAAELAENKRQFNSSMAYDYSRAAVSDSQYAKELAYKYAALEKENSQYNDSLAYDYAKLEEDKRQYDASLAEEQRQFNYKNGVGSSGTQSTSSSKTSNDSKKRIVVEDKYGSENVEEMFNSLPKDLRQYLKNSGNYSDSTTSRLMAIQTAANRSQDSISEEQAEWLLRYYGIDY